MCLTLAGCLAVACGPSSPPKNTASPPPDRDTTHAILDVDDKCGVLPTCGFQDEDGCPDVMVSFVPGTTTMSPSANTLLGEVAAELSVRSEISVVEVIGTAARDEPADYAKARAAVVAAVLIKRGAAAMRIRTRAHDKPGNAPGHVYFDVRCGGAVD